MQKSDSNSVSSGSTNWSAEDDRRKRHEAIWKQTCSRTHSLWCPCNDWTSHIRRWPTTTDDGEDADTPGGNAGEESAALTADKR
nr:ORF2 [Torque teno felis virus]